MPLDNPTAGKFIKFIKNLNFSTDVQAGDSPNPTVGRIIPWKPPRTFDAFTHIAETKAIPNPTAGKLAKITPPSTFDAFKHKAETTAIPNPTAGKLAIISTPNTFDAFTHTAETTAIPNPTVNAPMYNSLNNKSGYTFSKLDKDTKFSLTADSSISVKLISKYDPPSSLASNITQNSQLRQAAVIAGAGAATLFGLSTAADSIVALYEQSNLVRNFSTLEFNQLNKTPGVLLQDFRSKRILNKNVPVSLLRIDGTRAAFKGGKIGLPIASISPIGAYTIYNLNGIGQNGYGWGDHGSPYALRNDYTLHSNIRQIWKNDKWVKSGFPDNAIPFRGDRVTVIDFKKSKLLSNAYYWWPNDADPKTPETPFTKKLRKLDPRFTRDFIKFYFTGPTLYPGSIKETDDIMVFRSIINSLSDRFSPSWTPQQMVGRADPNYHYTGYSRELDLDFTVYATDRDELKPIWRKLNALAGYTAPTYRNDSIAMEAPWMRITIGDLFVQQACFISSLSYTLHDQETTWEINFEDDDEIMQVPHKINVSIGLTMITNTLPQKGGQFYSLAKQFSVSGSKPGNDNWLSDFNQFAPIATKTGVGSATTLGIAK